MQKFNMTIKNCRKTIFAKKCYVTLCTLAKKCDVTLCTKNFVEILYVAPSEINEFLHFMQKFNIAAKMAGKQIWLLVSCVSKISSKSLHFAPFLEINAFCVEIQDGHPMIFGRKWEMPAYILQLENFIKIAGPRTISEIKVFLHFMQKFKMATNNVRKMIFCTMWQMTLHIPSPTEILLKSLYLALSLRYMRFTQKFKMAGKNGKRTILPKSGRSTTYTLQLQNFNKIALSHIISEINVSLCFTQKLKMATKNNGKTILATTGKRLSVYLTSQKLCWNHSISNRFRDIKDFSFSSLRKIVAHS